MSTSSTATGDDLDPETGAASLPSSFSIETASVEPNSAERVVHNDTDHIVAEVTAARAMRLNGGYVPGEEFRESVPEWEHVPLPIGHPISPNGNYISARVPEVIEQAVVGYFQHVDYDEDDDALTGEIWVNVEKAQSLGEYGQRIIEILDNGEPLEVSTAYRADHGVPGVYDGEYRDPVRTNIRPDHLALLPDDLGPGKCSVEDGCGVNPDADADGSEDAPANDAGDDTEATPSMPFAGVEVDADVERVYLNTSADLSPAEDDSAAPADDPEQDADDTRTLAHRLLQTAQTLLSGQDAAPEIETDVDADACAACPDDSTDSPAPDADADTDTAEADTGTGEVDDSPTPNDMTDLHDKIASQTDFSADDLAALDDDFVESLANELLNDCDCADDCGCDGETNDADAEAAEADAEGADEPSLNADKFVTQEQFAALESTVEERLDELAAILNEEEQTKREELKDEITSNTDRFTDEELDDMSTETLEKTADLVAPEEPEPAVNAEPPRTSGTDLSALRPTKTVSNDDGIDEDDLPSSGSLAEYRKRNAGN